MIHSPARVTEILNAIGQGERSAADELVPMLYDELHRMAAAQMSRERANHTLQTTAVVNEVYLRLVDQRNLSQLGRSEFMALAAQTIRRVLVDHARAAGREKRGGQARPVTLSESVAGSSGDAIEVLALDEALVELARLEPRHARLVELRFFAGLNNKEIATVLSVSLSTVEKDWRFVRSWLAQRLGAGADAE